MPCTWNQLLNICDVDIRRFLMSTHCKRLGWSLQKFSRWLIHCHDDTPASSVTMMSAGAAGGVDSETLAGCYFDPLCLWGPVVTPPSAPPSHRPHCEGKLFLFSSFCLYFLSSSALPADSSPPPSAPFDHRIVTPKPHQIATYYTINRDEVLGG